MITKSEIQNKLKTLSLEEQKVAYGLLDKLDIDVSKGDGRLTGVKPSGFYLEGKFYAVDHHREILLKVAEIAVAKNPTETAKFLEISGRKRNYFSKDYRELSFDYKRIAGTDIYAELNENARTLNKRCEAIIMKFGMVLYSFKIT
jgi:hypothetical protein